MLFRSQLRIAAWASGVARVPDLSAAHLLRDGEPLIPFGHPAGP